MTKVGAPFGERHGKAALTDEQVEAIRAEHAPRKHGKGYGSLAKKYNVGESTIRDIVNYFTRPTR